MLWEKLMRNNYHNTLHGLCTGRGMGTTSLKAIMIQQLTVLRWEVLYEIFLDRHKDYDALYCILCHDIIVT